ncbi:TPA: hypothetical protein ACKONR_001190 [Clostridioides difficile]|uniref:hypothetical protein n=1 Tax=Clostridioides difficile TaxID=1496 RepID=UPI00097FEBFA|nr:hypothetical protein [Clostridioides difficile]AXU29187.1 37-kD nucleoid-associated bacterial protein [Clostridioides difficile]AXU32975.1 37-kD nucleoid-associated bacterial protein [Clostridioides difficile]AXU36763.1 37-kD nucleoid-associated bacterial protein [Clostridioides difficile]MCP8413117.1 hypothetical protein [Clostridioides difficile]MDC9390852.1 hypothetical protein [Clostridioides difficile]
MELISKSIYTIDYENSLISSRSIPDYFNEYIESLIEFVDENINVRLYRTRSQATQVVTNIKNIINESIREDIDKDVITLNHKEIAERLLLKEIEAQERISRMGTNIKKGSIIQVLLKEKTSDCYRYVIAKVDYLDFIDDTDFRKKIGFSAKNKDIGKTCIIETTSLEDDEIFIDNAKVYLDGQAKYWTDDFLELIEMRSDETNTKMVFKEVEAVLKRYIKRKSPKDFTILRNSLIGKLRSNNHIDYNTNIVKELVRDYTPEDESMLDSSFMENLVEKLRELPTKKNFDLQFQSVPSAINAKIKKRYPVYTGIEIKVDSYINDIKEIITSIEEVDGSRYIKIKTTNDDTFNCFK